jgi:feruloyl esterase
MLHWYTGPDQTATINIGTYSTLGYRDSRHDIVLAMMAWAQNDTAPNEIVATKWKNDTTMNSRASVQSATVLPLPGKV